MLGSKLFAAGVQVLVKHHPHPGRKIEALQETSIQTDSANDVQDVICIRHSSNKEQTERRAFGSLFFFQKCSRRHIRARQRLLVAELRRPLRRGDDGAAIVGELEKVEALGFGNHLCVVEKHAVIRSRLLGGDGDSACLWGSGNCLNSAGNLISTAIKFTPELRN